MVEHNIKGVLNIVDRAYVLDEGRVVFEGTPQSVRETDILTQVIWGRRGLIQNTTPLRGPSLLNTAAFSCNDHVILGPLTADRHAASEGKRIRRVA